MVQLAEHGSAGRVRAPAPTCALAGPSKTCLTLHLYLQDLTWEPHHSRPGSRSRVQAIEVHRSTLACFKGRVVSLHSFDPNAKGAFQLVQLRALVSGEQGGSHA